MHKMTKLPIDEYRFSLVLVVAACLLMSACSDSSTGGGLGNESQASFTAIPLSNNANKIVVKSTTEDAFMWRWDFGNGASSSQEVDTATYINKGEYTINLTAFSQGGSDSTSKQITIENDYQGENALRNDGALVPSNWTFLSMGSNQINVNYSDNTATFTSNQYSYGAIYMPVQVEAGAEYVFSAQVESSSGMGSQAWFEVYMGTTEPTQGSDYTDNLIAGLNTYVPCGGSPFDADLVDIACTGSATESGGIVTFSQTGTVYLVIKAGSNGGTLGQGGVTLNSINLAKL